MSDPTGNPGGNPPAPNETPAPDPTTDDPTSSSETLSSSSEETSSSSEVTETSSSTIAEETSTTSTQQESTTSSIEETTTTSESSTSTQESTTSEESTSTTEPPSSTTTEPPTSTRPDRTTITLSNTRDNGEVITSVILITSTKTNPETDSAPAPTTTSATPGTIDPSADNENGGLNKGAKVAIGVVVPIVAIAVIAIAALFWWKKRRARQEAEEERRKEVEDYSYNPNADPTIPAVATHDNSYEMREDGSSGYRGWGTTTVAGSTGRKASTTMSGGAAGNAYSDVTTSPTRGTASEARSGEPLMEGEILGAMGPSAANNRNGDVRRGPSNASSSYSAANRSENSDGVGMTYSDGGYDQYGQANPYVDNGYGGRPQEAPGQPIIRDNPARRNTRIENPSHYPQQSAGISQNF